MKVELDKEDIINLLKGASDQILLGSNLFDVFGRFEGGGFNDPVWEWDIDKLNQTAEEVLITIYFMIKKK